MCQIQHSMKILAQSVCCFSETCRDKRSFPSNQIKVLVLLKNTSNTLLTYCYLWKPQRWKNKIIALFYHNCFLQWWIHISLYIVQLLVIHLELNFHQEIKYNYNVKYIMINGIILYSEFISCNSEFLIPDLRSNFRLLEFLGTDLQPFLIWVDLFQLFRCGLHSRVNQNWSKYISVIKWFALPKFRP